MPDQSQDYAVVIGVNDYPRFGASGRPLAGAINDATAFANWLTDHHTGGGLPDENCALICSTADPLQPTQQPIDEALDDIFAHAEECGGRRFYFYFAGHGHARESLDVALCLCNWSRRFRHAALSSERYRELFLSCTPFSEIVILLDCCRIRSVDAAGQMPTLGCAKPVDNVGEKRFLIGYAAELQNASFEATVAQSRGASIDQEGPLVHGHFTRALLAALYGGAAQATGGVTANGLKEYLEREVPRIAREHEHDQRAVVQSNFGQDAQPVFGSAQPLANFRISFSPARHGQIRLEAPDLRSIRSGDASSGPWDVSLAQGLHRLVELESGDELIIRFRPSDGTTHVVF